MTRREYPPGIVRVLKLAEQYALVCEVPKELKNELTFCIGRRFVRITHVAALLDPDDAPLPMTPKGPYVDGPFKIVLPGTRIHPQRLLLRQRGHAVLAKSRIHSEEPSPASAKVKKKRGRRSDPDGDKKIATEFYKGREDGRWKSQAEYLRKQYPKRTAAWLSDLLRRVRDHENP